ncbi:uncharacterized protein SRS1_15848 [Sporisorium reilianum f. sp. reilianum]|uniref:Uncharacterized protein n=1 Tax=Sporisorium reilianum f. sp. reilianum TaxID=72559 RepID=A0A2N8UJY3_9BASI|nr:uncharacterized protein SRS1_15848 [Sporisorium reilianum f. sp. reilianum]
MSDADTSKSLRLALATGTLLRVYFVFDDPGTECRVSDGSVALAKVIFLRTCRITKIKVCSYHFVAPASRSASSVEAGQLGDQPALHHVLRPGQVAGTSSAALALSSTP